MKEKEENSIPVIDDDKVTFFKNKIENSPTFYMHYYKLGEALEKTGQLDGAIAAYKRSTELNNKYSFSYDSLARVLVTKGQIDEAIETYRNAIKLNPNFYGFHYSLALAAFKKDYLDEALTELQKCVDENCIHYPSYELIGEILIKQGKLKEAIASYEKLLNLDTDINRSNNILKAVYDLKNNVNSNQINISSSFWHHLQLNSDFWNQNQPSLKNQWIIVDSFVPRKNKLDIYYTFRNLLAAKYLQKIYGFRIMAWINPRHYQLKIVLSSFGVEKFIYHVDERIGLTQDQESELEEFKSKANLENFKHLMKSFKTNNLHIGDLMYDCLLKQQCLSTPIFDKQVINHLETGCRRVNFWKNILNSYDVKAVILGHIPQIRGILARLAIQRDVVVFGVKKGWLFRRYDTLDELYDFPTFISQELFQYFWNNHKEKALYIGKELLENQMGVKKASAKLVGNSAMYVTLAYAKTKKVYSREEICNELGLDHSLPIVIVASHVFNDSPHGHRHRIFVDYYEWLVETLKICSQINSVNWLIKEHPHVGLKKQSYNVEKTAKKLVLNEYNGLSNIKLVPEDMSNISLLDFCHAIVTISSTMSHELACFGVPSILAGSSNVSSCGFTHNAKDFEDYKTMLYSIKSLERLKSEEVEKAYVAYAILFHFTRVQSDLSIDGDLSLAMKNMVENKIKQCKNIEEDYFFRNFAIQLMLNHKLSLRYDELMSFN